MHAKGSIFVLSAMEITKINFIICTKFLNIETIDKFSMFDKIILVFFTRSKYRLVINDEKVIFKFLVLSVAVALSKYHFVHISKKCINLELSQESANDLMTPIFILKVIFVRSSTNIGNFVIIQEKHGCHGKFLFLIG